MKINLIMCISKILTDLCAIKQKIKLKKNFCKCCLQCFSSEKILIVDQLVLKIISNNYLFLLKFMLILSVF